MSSAETKRLKVLLGCYNCSPYHGSEKGVGWNFLHRIAQHFEVHAIVEEMECREPLERYRAEHPEVFEHIHLYFVRKVRHRLLRKIWPPSYYYFYDKWEKKAYRLAVELDKKENFDLVHRITMCGYRRPGYLWKLGKPFIWGPVGGLNNTDVRLLSELNLYHRLYFRARNLMNTLQLRYGQAAKVAAKHTDILYTADPHVNDDVRKYWHLEPKLLGEIGTPTLAQFPEPSCHEPGTPMRLCWSGILEPLKALDIVLRALPQCSCPMELHVLGKGYMEQKWKIMAEKLGVADKVHFHGFMPHDEAVAFMGSCHLFCFSSIKEGGMGTVVLEAMQNALPVIAIDHCAFSACITDTCGIKIPVQSPEGISKAFAEHFDALATDESRRMALAHGALKRSQEYTWDKKIRQLCADYERITLNNQSTTAKF